MSLLRTFLQSLCPLIDRALKFTSSQMPGVLITRKGNLPYLWRFYFEDKVTKEKGLEAQKSDEENTKSQFGVFLHRFVDSDEVGEIHNHPWTYCVSIILTGGYFENRCKWEFDESKTLEDGTRFARLGEMTLETHLPFSINVIQHDDMHRVTLMNGPAWTLFFHGPRVGTWGFADLTTMKYREIKRRTASFVKQGIV